MINTVRCSRRVAVPLLGAVIVFVAGLPAALAADPVPASCQVHPNKVLTPGCWHALTGIVEDALPAGPLPNLVPRILYVETYPTEPTYVDPLGVVNGFPSGRPWLRFGTAAVNQGLAALDVLGVPSADPLTFTAHQCTAWTQRRVCLARALVGEMAWHPAHGHFHYQDFARYELRMLDASGSPDMSGGGLLAASDKVSFCLQDSARQAEDADEQFYVGCPGVLQGISSGWADIYDSYLPGQALPIAHLADGRYGLVVTLDPSNRLHESVESDNVTWVTVELFDNAKQARIVE